MHKGRRQWLAAALGIVLSGCGPTPTRRILPDPSMVAWWAFDDGVGTVAQDASGHQNSAAIANGSWGAGHAGAALLMDGGNDGIVTVAVSDSLRSPTDAITVMAWTYRTAKHNVAVISHGYPTLFFGFHGAQFKWQFERANGRMMACYAEPKYEAKLDQWIHLAATYNGWVARLYADGVEVCSKWTWGAIKSTDAPFTISGYLDGSGRIIDEITGRLDDVRIYNRALSAEEIQKAAGLVN